MAVPRLNAEAYFAVFLSMAGNRTIPATIEAAGLMGMPQPHLRTIQKWSAKANWYRRAEEFDQRVSARAVEIAEIDEAERDARHLRLARLIGDKAVEALPTIPLRTPSDVVTYSKLAVDIERMVTGAATTRSEVALSFAREGLRQVVRVFISINQIPDPNQREVQMVQALEELGTRFIRSQS